MTDTGLLTKRGRHGAQGVLDSASKATLENEFGTHNEDECMTKILEMGLIREMEVSVKDYLSYDIRAV